ncbi:hypothetical protein C4901_10610 [Acidiferrobacter sp. SPIII_3]|nr:hypothetical protein C4901_10610 [Acidiferrobacter sp. SPIII_3]
MTQRRYTTMPGFCPAPEVRWYREGLVLRTITTFRIAGMPIPVVVISAFADQTRVKEALNHGAAYLLEKPFSTSDLKRVLERLWQEPKGLIGARERALNQATLTNKECEVARLLLKGLSTQEMARLTGNSEKTLKQHISTIYEKCGVSSRTEFFHYIFPT